MMSVLCVGAGGFVGAVSRYGLGLIPLTSGLPLVTLLINLVGSVVIGAVAEAASLTPTALPREAVLFLKVGLCGGFTTFSTFMNEGSSLMKDEQYLYMMLYLFGSLILGLIAVMAGHQLAKFF